MLSDSFKHLARRTSTAIVQRAFPANERGRAPQALAHAGARRSWFISYERDRWFIWTPVIFAAGVLFYFKLKSEPSVIETILLLVVLVAIHCWALRSAKHFKLLTTTLLIAHCGFCSAHLRTATVSQAKLHRSIHNATVVGWVELLEARSANRWRITLRVHQILERADRALPKRLRLHASNLPASLTVGDAVRIEARLLPLPTAALPGGYDFARAAFFHEIGGIGFTRKQPEKVQIAEALPWQLRATVAIEKLRARIGARIHAALPGETGAIANALMTGTRGAVSRETNEAYRDSGIFHILSISGLHMAIMGGSVFLLLRVLAALFPPLVLSLPTKKIAAIAAMLAALCYLLISGMAFATVRSFLMIAIMFLAIVVDRPAIALRNVALAALIILVVRPESLLNLGFQMSFAAVIALVAAYEWFRERRLRQAGFESFRDAHWFVRSLRLTALFAAGIIATTLIAGISVAPFSAFHFHKTQPLSALTNLIAVPISNVVVMPAALAAFIALPLGFEHWPLKAMGLGIDWMTWSAKQVAALPGAVVPIPAFSEFALGCMLFGMLWLAIWRRAWRLLGTLPIALGLYFAAHHERPAVMVGVNGALVAVRDIETGQYVALRARNASFQLKRWLEHDADSREVDAVWGTTGFRCDREGCTHELGRHRLAVPRSPSALMDDCRSASILILSFPRPSGCRSTAHVVDSIAVRRHGTHAIYLTKDGGIRIDTVADWRGKRPWSKDVPSRNRFPETARQSNSNSVRDELGSPDLQDGNPLYWLY